jgi:hypothetical protein
MSDMQQQLSAPFPPADVSWRVGATNKDKTKGMALAYIDARDVMARLDTVVGSENWQDEYTETAKGRIFCKLSIQVDGQWVTKSDGAGDTDYEGDKGAISDAFKRAAVKWGIGRYLYGLDSPWVEIEMKGNTAVLPQASKLRLQGILQGKGAPPPTQKKPQANAPTSPYTYSDGEIVADAGRDIFDQFKAAHHGRIPASRDEMASWYKAQKDGQSPTPPPAPEQGTAGDVDGVAPLLDGVHYQALLSKIDPNIGDVIAALNGDNVTTSQLARGIIEQLYAEIKPTPAKKLKPETAATMYEAVVIHLGDTVA